MSRGSRSAYEFAVIAVVVVLAVILGAGLYSGRMKVQKSNLLVQELASLRSSLTLYKTLNRENAPSLKVLASSEYEVGGTTRPFIERLPISEDGDVIDPFGNPYAYDQKTGWVSSATPGFERW